MVPEYLRRLERDPKIKIRKKRGRKKSLITLGYFLYHRKVRILHRKKVRSREAFLRGLGIRKKMDFSAPPWQRMTLKEIAENQKFQHLLERKVNKDRRVVTVPVLTQEEIFARNNEWRKVRNREKFFVSADFLYGEYFFYFGMIMPDNCMVNDGICKGDRIAAVSNLRPGEGDMVVCRIPGTNHITVRRFVFTASMLFHTLYEGGTTNPMLVQKEENLIYGVVVDVQRFYRPSRLPKTRPLNLLEHMRGISPNIPDESEADVVPGGYRIKFKRNPAARQALHEGLMDWKMLRTFRIVERVRLIKADKWPSRTPVIKRKGKKRGPKKKLRMKIAAFNRLKTEIAETYRNFKAEMDKYER